MKRSQHGWKNRRSFYRRLTDWVTRFDRRIKHDFFEHTILLSVLILAVGFAIALIAYMAFPELQNDFWPGVFVEFNGMLFDIAVFGILIAFFQRITARRRDVKQQQEIIEDFKKWNNAEAHFRIAGAIRRINRLGKLNIDLRGIELRDFSFHRNDIRNITGSVFYDGNWLDMGSRDNMSLEKVDFSFVHCNGVVFSKSQNILGLRAQQATIRDCTFHDSDLNEAVFEGAILEWTMNHPELLGQWDRTTEGEAYFEQTHYPPFYRADLTGASFAYAHFKNADFRDADGLLDCDFTGAKGIETCLFDDEETKIAVTEMSRKQ